MTNDQASPSAFPPGYLEEYNGDGPSAVAIVFIILEVFCVMLRFWARKMGKVAWGADDTLMIPGVIFCLALIGTCLADIHYGGVGYHQAAVAATSPSKLITWAKYTLIIPTMYLPAVVFPKLAITVMYLRVFTRRASRITCWVVAGGMIANLIGTLIPAFFMCVPLEYLWNRTIPGGRCINVNAWYRWASLMNIITDVILLILPQPMIWKMQSSKKVKLGLTITFATGSIGLITSVIRFGGFFMADALSDGTWAASNLIILIIIESGTYLIAACLPTYRPLALLLWRNTPVSSFLLNTRTNKSGSTDRHGTYDVRSGLDENNSFTRLHEDEQRPSCHKSEDIVQGEYLGTMLKDSRRVVVRHDVDVVFEPSITRNKC